MKTYNLDQTETSLEEQKGAGELSPKEFVKAFRDIAIPSPIKAIGIKLEENRSKWLADLGAKIDMQSPTLASSEFEIDLSPAEFPTIFPNESGKNQIPRRILKLANEKQSFTTFNIAKCINSKLTADEFKRNPKWRIKARIRIKSLNKTLKIHKFFITTKGEVHSIIER